MNTKNALAIWGYSNTYKNREALRKICKMHPDICESLSPIKIKKRVKKIYLPDGRTKDTYVHIVRAIKNSAHLYPEVIGLTVSKLRTQLRQLNDAGIIEKNNNVKTSKTEDYNTTLHTEDWLNKRKYQRIKYLVKFLEPLKPTIGLTFNYGHV